MAPEQRIPLDLSDHLLRIPFCYGKNPEGDILENLDENSAQAEHQDRPEIGIAGNPDDGLHACRRHLLHGNADDVLIAVGPDDFPVRLPHLFGTVQVEPDPTGIRFVDDIRGDNLQRNGIADGAGHSGRLVLGTGNEAAGGRDPYRLQDFLGFMLHQVGSVFPARLPQNFGEFRCRNPSGQPAVRVRFFRLVRIRKGQSWRESGLTKAGFQSCLSLLHDTPSCSLPHRRTRSSVKAVWSFRF